MKWNVVFGYHHVAKQSTRLDAVNVRTQRLTLILARRTEKLVKVA